MTTTCTNAIRCAHFGQVPWNPEYYFQNAASLALQFELKECAIMSPFSGPQPWERFFFFEHLIRPHLSRPKTSIQQSIPSPSEGLRSGFWKRQSHRMAPGNGPWPRPAFIVSEEGLYAQGPVKEGLAINAEMERERRNKSKEGCR